MKIRIIWEGKTRERGGIIVGSFSASPLMVLDSRRNEYFLETTEPGSQWPDKENSSVVKSLLSQGRKVLVLENPTIRSYSDPDGNWLIFATKWQKRPT